MNTTLSDYFGLLHSYLRPQLGRVFVLAVLLFGGIALQLYSPQVIRTFIDTAERGAAPAALAGVALIFLAVVLVERTAAITITYVSKNVAWTATNGLRRDLARHVLKLDMSFHNAHTPGELLERVDGDVDQLANFFSEFLLQIIGGLLLAAGVLALLWGEDWRIGVVLALFVVAYLIVHTRGQQMAAPHWERQRQYEADLSGFVEERIAGVRDIQTNGAVAYTMRRFYDLVRRSTWQGLRADVMTDIGWTISKIFYELGTVAGLGLGAYLYLSGQITLGTVYLIIHYLAMLNGPLNRIAGQLEDLQQARVAIGRVRTLFATLQRVADGPGADLPAGQALGVAFERVTFGYHDGAPVLKNVTFALSPGQKLGLLGRTGSGKTTIARLLFRLYDVDGGCIGLHGADVRQLHLADLRRRVGMVTQEVQLFPASVRDNLTLFNPMVADAALWDSLRTLGLDTWVQGLPQGLDTVLAADGGGMSAGEAQLLALARVFLKDPGVVILDEASSRLDPATERLLERALDTLLANRTTIIIAHRLSTVRRADQILILEEGRVKESGSYRSLANDDQSIFAGLLRTTDLRNAQTLDDVAASGGHSIRQNQKPKIEEVLA